MPTYPQGFILTGGPGSGKSTLIHQLAQQGYTCSVEAGRAVIQEQVATGGNAVPWGDVLAFADHMLCKEIHAWQRAQPQAVPCFFDRGIPDIAGYLCLCDLAIPLSLDKAINQYRYAEKVFIAPPWREIYVQDAERKQSVEEAERTYHMMCEIYPRYGYQLVELPRASVEERIAFILAESGIPS
ncbi:ATPase [Enterobacterales bacterium CwR94]|nr:ATPase [Enterobacterales bacterium CwR94]